MLEAADTAVDKTLVWEGLGGDAIEVSETEVADGITLELELELIVGETVSAVLDPVPTRTVLWTMTVVDSIVDATELATVVLLLEAPSVELGVSVAVPVDKRDESNEL